MQFGSTSHSLAGCIGVCLEAIVPLKQIEYGVDGDLVIIYPKPYSIYLKGTITLNP